MRLLAQGHIRSLATSVYVVVCKSKIKMAAPIAEPQTAGGTDPSDEEDAVSPGLVKHNTRARKSSTLRLKRELDGGLAESADHHFKMLMEVGACGV